jgi:hypothetical protein
MSLSSRNKILNWTDLSKVAKKAFQLTNHDRPLKWAKESWQVITESGLADYYDNKSRLKVILRFFALIDIYLDYFSIIMEESGYENRAYDWIDELGVSPEDLRMFTGATLADEFDDEEVLISAINDSREEVYKVLLRSLGGVNRLFLFMYRTTHSTDEGKEAIDDVPTPKQMAYEWVEQGCEKYS